MVVMVVVVVLVVMVVLVVVVVVWWAGFLVRRVVSFGRTVGLVCIWSCVSGCYK